jgi:hypothetical protein
VTKSTRDNHGKVSSLWGLTWVCMAFWTAIMLMLTIVNVGSLAHSAARHGVAVTSRGLLFFLAVLIAWLGVDCHSVNIAHSTVRAYGLNLIFSCLHCP